MSKCDYCDNTNDCKECWGIKEVNLGVSKIIEQIREKHDKFVLETILPYCNEITKMELSKDDIMEAFRIWTAFRDGRLEWRNPAVVRKGKWIEKDGWDGDVYYDCSVCGKSWTTIEGTPWDNGMNYCPNCGAKMEGSEEDGLHTV